jgi:hypothetical protein
MIDLPAGLDWFEQDCASVAVAWQQIKAVKKPAHAILRLASSATYAETSRCGQ